MPELHRLRVLREVARLGSMSAAAASLSYSQPAISHHVSRLEAEAGTPLVARHARGVRLTEAGRILADHAESALAALAEADEKVAAIAGLRAGRVRLAAFPTAASSFVPDALAALRNRAGDVRGALSEAEPAEALAALRAGETDIAVAFDYAETSGDADMRLRFVPLARDPVVLAVPDGHPAAGGEPPSLADLSGEAWASGCRRCRDHVEFRCRVAGFQPRVDFATDQYVAVQRLVARGLAVSALPNLAFACHSEPGVARIALPELGSRRIYAAVSAGPQPPAVAAMLDELATAAGRVDPAGVRAPAAGGGAPSRAAGGSGSG
ncbi:LysR family transcriptional regulator [Streptomonospora wellingtoniae]|uniref:LysR family transcriptional regulator n=1 Tax=Streptomonospora wellingtoniae TaxID=3075544 RepID=A0ABU2KZP8_9ACTN|nr:LysR family transcriptional regulator [Streptomonospora sp. DSM 45055]MDT0304775.1 LysR family transcriptional regulator [Streptomonospora sp. DSM 45055]